MVCGLAPTEREGSECEFDRNGPEVPPRGGRNLIRMMLFDMIEELEHHVVREAGNLDEAHPARGMRRSNFRLKPWPPVK